MNTFDTVYNQFTALLPDDKSADAQETRNRFYGMARNTIERALARGAEDYGMSRGTNAIDFWEHWSNLQLRD